MRDTIIAYVTALASSSAVFRFGYDLPSPLAMFMAAVAALVGIAAVYGLTKAWAWSRPVRAAWHRQRARALADRQSTISSLWPWAVVAWLVMAIAEWGHVLRAESIGS